MFFPPLGTAVAAGVLGLTAASAAIKTSLYAGDARDANGNLIVSGWSLVHSYADVALSAGAIGAAAGVERAGTLAAGGKTTFSEELGRQFSTKAFKQELKIRIADTSKLYEKAGAKAVAKTLVKEGIEPFGEGQAGRALNWGGLVVGGAGPAGNSLDASNVFGWRSVQHIWPEARDLLKKEPEAPDLQLKTAPVMASAAHPKTAVRPSEPPPPPPVMDR